jgi:hypothetical protein
MYEALAYDSNESRSAVAGAACTMIRQAYASIALHDDIEGASEAWYRISVWSTESRRCAQAASRCGRQREQRASR